ncbi:hypothetical protein CBR_g3817 [Chara braunii]|uniref:DDE Tnp4 domain-containing protein n=1 Tax=Chara braunii TaxID=69332 RepID=A0A388KGF6_CHABU|nr:hypothetical protein CBR_g3817 [Chara braunii]|eukprot:GBG69119.1 hypothetical protein CBR_g3817 [Chara braunii]
MQDGVNNEEVDAPVSCSSGQRANMTDGVFPGVGRLSLQQKLGVVIAIVAVIRHMGKQREMAWEAALVRAKRLRLVSPWPREVVNNVTLWDGPLLLANAIVADILLRQPPRWWMKRRTGGTWEDLCVHDDAAEEYFHDKLWMSKSVFYGIVAALSSYLQRQITPFRQPLQPKRIVAYAVYRWASSETYDSGTSNFGIGRASGIAAVEDVTRALHRAYPDKIKMPTGSRRKQVMDAFERKRFPRCMGAIDCTHLYVDKPANAPAENFCDRHRQFSVVAQVVVDMDMRILDVFVGYPGSVHDSRVLRNSSLYRRAQAGAIFDADPLVLPYARLCSG